MSLKPRFSKRNTHFCVVPASFVFFKLIRARPLAQISLNHVTSHGQSQWRPDLWPLNPTNLTQLWNSAVQVAVVKAVLYCKNIHLIGHMERLYRIGRKISIWGFLYTIDFTPLLRIIVVFLLNPTCQASKGGGNLT